MQFIDQLIIKLFNRQVGHDEFGNIYFEGKNGRRFVVYKGIAEPTKIPSEWHSWIHYTTDIIPVNINTHKHSWQKIHLPNLTGTKNAHSPKATQTKIRKPYQAWNPNN